MSNTTALLLLLLVSSSFPILPTGHLWSTRFPPSLYKPKYWPRPGYRSKHNQQKDIHGLILQTSVKEKWPPACFCFVVCRQDSCRTEISVLG